MKTSTKLDIRVMLADAYSRLGIRSVKEIDKMVYQALDYLAQDREHYIEVADKDLPEYMITFCYGKICKLIPFARSVSHKQLKDHISEQTTVLMLMVEGETVRYVSAESHTKRYANPAQNSYSFPVHRYLELEEIPETFQVCAPQEIRPIATARDWEIYTMMFEVFKQCCKDRPINYIPQKTERAMLYYAHAPSEELTVDGKKLTGKLIPLATCAPQQEMRWDHWYERKGELYLLVTADTQRHLVKTLHIYRYFRKIIHDDVPGGCSYHDTNTKRETTYSFIGPEDLPQDLHPFYY